MDSPSPDNNHVGPLGSYQREMQLRENLPSEDEILALKYSPHLHRRLGVDIDADDSTLSLAFRMVAARLNVIDQEDQVLNRKRSDALKLALEAYKVLKDREAYAKWCEHYEMPNLRPIQMDSSLRGTALAINSDSLRLQAYTISLLEALKGVSITDTSVKTNGMSIIETLDMLEDQVPEIGAQVLFKPSVQDAAYTVFIKSISEDSFATASRLQKTYRFDLKPHREQICKAVELELERVAEQIYAAHPKNPELELGVLESSALELEAAKASESEEVRRAIDRDENHIPVSNAAAFIKAYCPALLNESSIEAAVAGALVAYDETIDPEGYQEAFRTYLLELGYLKNDLQRLGGDTLTDRDQKIREELLGERRISAHRLVEVLLDADSQEKILSDPRIRTRAYSLLTEECYDITLAEEHLGYLCGIPFQNIPREIGLPLPEYAQFLVEWIGVELERDPYMTADRLVILTEALKEHREPLLADSRLQERSASYMRNETDRLLGKQPAFYPAGIAPELEGERVTLADRIETMAVFAFEFDQWDMFCGLGHELLDQADRLPADPYWSEIAALVLKEAGELAEQRK